MPGKTIVILGGGVGGIVAANRLRQLLDREHRVVLVDRTIWHSFAPSYTWLMLGWRKAERLNRDIRSLQRKNIDVIIGEITNIDLAQRRVNLDGEQTLLYDYLVVSLGVDYSAEGIPGLGLAWTYYSLDGAEGLRECLPGFRKGRLAILISAVPYKCPAAPYEGALLLDYYFRKQGIRNEVEIQIYTPEPQPMPVAGAEVGEQMMEILAGREVWFSPDAQVKSVDNEKKVITFQDGTEGKYDLLIATPIHKSPQVVKNAGLTKGEWIAVDRETLATTFEGVYAIGDVTAIPLANGLMLPKAGVFAHGQAEVVAREIAIRINGGTTGWAFGGEGT